IMGLLVKSVNRDGPAFDAGIMPGDIILKIGDELVQSKMHARALLREFSEGDSIRVELLRDNKRYGTKMMLRKRVKESPGPDRDEFDEAYLSFLHSRNCCTRLWCSSFSQNCTKVSSSASIACRRAWVNRMAPSLRFLMNARLLWVSCPAHLMLSSCKLPESAMRSIRLVLSAVRALMIRASASQRRAVERPTRSISRVSPPQPGGR